MNKFMCNKDSISISVEVLDKYKDVNTLKQAIRKARQDNDLQLLHDLQLFRDFYENKGKFVEINGSNIFIDNEIIDTVKYINEIGIPTFSSCAGHMCSRPYIALDGFYKIKSNDKLVIEYKILGHITAIYYNHIARNSKDYLKGLLEFDAILTSMIYLDFKPININDIKFGDSLVERYCKYKLNLSSEYPKEITDKQEQLWSQILKERYKQNSMNMNYF